MSQESMREDNQAIIAPGYEERTFCATFAGPGMGRCTTYQVSLAFDIVLLWYHESDANSLSGGCVCELRVCVSLGSESVTILGQKHSRVNVREHNNSLEEIRPDSDVVGG
ncbi:hypothetical protein PILCRDRAFT_750131 [Piloderma croceum F 1598]|uniref:Uncharacterized protein n=1 Tax=Piloderma croceum (strain F 1598) TaxID=765440 RepID=A0A0C3AD67_PILCF|nr:hypothetical protein PILCRDRAFT_750131 [Piloderma croceum F 1598]